MHIVHHNYDKWHRPTYLKPQDKATLQTKGKKSIGQTKTATKVNQEKLTQTFILAFINRGIKRQNETQLTPEWSTKPDTRIVFKHWSKKKYIYILR